MLFNTLACDLPTLDQIINPISLSISPDQSILDAIALITQATPYREGTGSLTQKTEVSLYRTIVVEGDDSIGILGEQEIINAIATKKDLANLAVGEVMTPAKITLNVDKESDVSQILFLLQHHKLDQILVVNSHRKVRGIIKSQTILQHLKPIIHPEFTAFKEKEITPKNDLELLENYRMYEEKENSYQEKIMRKISEYKTQLEVTHKHTQQAINQYKLIQRIDQKLRSSQQEIRSFLAALTDVVLIIHLQEDVIEIKDIPPNQFYSAYPDIIQETIQQFSQPAQAKWVIPPIQQALQTQDVVSFEYDLRSETRMSWFSAKISPLSKNTVVWVAQDITARKQAELEFQQLAAELEHRITERTSELQKVNTELRQALEEREITEQQLRDSTQKFRQLAESIREVFFIWSLDGLELLYVSPAFEEVWGISPEHLYKNPNLWMAMIHPEDRQDIEEIFSAEFQNGNWDHEFRIIRPDEEIRWIWTRSFPVKNESGVVYRIVGLAEDITERRRVREALEEREGQLATLADISPVGIFRTDMTGEYLYVNERVSEIVGQSLRDFKTQHWLSMVHPSDRQNIEQAWPVAQDDYEPIELEYRLNRSDEAIIWVFARVIPDYDDWGVVKGFIGTLTDISERKQIETELQQLNQQLEVMVEQRTEQLQQTNEKLRQEIDHRQQVQNQIATKAYQQAIIANLGQKALSGIELSELIEQVILKVSRCLNVESVQVQEVPLKNPELLQLLTEVPSQDDLPLDSSKLENIRPSDLNSEFVEQPITVDRVDINCKCCGISIAMESRTSCFGLLSAYTEQQRIFSREDVYFLQSVAQILATAIERNTTEMQLKNSLQEKEVLLKEIHHRVKNNLLVVSNILDFQTDYTESEEVIEILHESQKRIESMALIHEKLYQSTGLNKVDFGDYIQDLVSQLMESYDQSSDLIELELDTDSILLNIETAHPCALIVNELVSNAFKHAFPDNRSGKISVELHQNLEQDIILTIRDNGIGFPENFDFRSGDSLGMELISTLVDQLEGNMEMIQDQGATFCLTFKELQYRQRY